MSACIFRNPFEWLILSANPMKDAELRDILKNPASYIASEEFFSWERFFTRILMEKTRGSYLQYPKKQLNPAYLKGGVRKAILQQMEQICLQN